MKKLLLTSAFFLCFGGLSLHASENDIEEVNDQASVVRTFEELSLEEQEMQNKRVEELVEVSQKKREDLAKQNLLDSLVTNFETMQNVEGAEEICTGLAALMAKLQGMEPPRAETFVGYTEKEWPEQEQGHWTSITNLLKANTYGEKKDAIQGFESAFRTLQEERNGFRYTAFQFNDDSNAEDQTLTPVIEKHANLIEGLNKQTIALQSNLDAFEEKLGKPGREIVEGMVTQFQIQCLWENQSATLLNGLHLAQQYGWENWTRHYLVKAIFSCRESSKLAENELGALMSQLQVLQQSASNAD